MELLANIAAGHADAPELSREQALDGLTRLVTSLRQRPAGPDASAPRGCSATSWTSPPASGSGPLAADVEKRNDPGRLRPRAGRGDLEGHARQGLDRPAQQRPEADIQRGRQYGCDHFDGAARPYSDDATRQKIMAILDRRVVMVVFGDNANLSASVAKTIGALLAPEPSRTARGRRRSGGELERSWRTRRRDTPSCTTPKAGLFYFGWDATRDRLFGWVDLQGNWTTGHMDYLVNEFRAPATSSSARFGLPVRRDPEPGLQDEALPDAGRRETSTPWPPGRARPSRRWAWDRGSASWTSPSWRTLLTNVVDIEIDFATRKGCPASSPSHTPATAPSIPATSASRRSPSTPGRGSPTPPRSTPWARPTRSRPRRSSGSWRRTGRSSRRS